MFRIGMASSLDILEVNTAAINLHLGWLAKSNMLMDYRRKVIVTKSSRQLYFNVFSATSNEVALSL